MKYNCIILCGGKGTRMQSNNQHKVCFNIQGKPAIHHAMDRYIKAGLDKFTVVVGSMAEQVMNCISSSYEGVAYAFQPEALGTGNAARCGFESLSCVDENSALLITMGDKIITPKALRLLLNTFEETGSDLVFAVQPREQNVLGGHIAQRDGNVAGIIESLDIQKADIFRQLLAELENNKELDARKYIEDLSGGVIASERKRKKVLQQMEHIFKFIHDGQVDIAIRVLKSGSSIVLGDEEFTPEELNSAEYVNSAVYIFKPKAFKYSLNAVSTNNANGEEYLTDMVTAICGNPNMGCSVVPYENNKDILTYNNVPELLRVEEILSEETRDLELPEGIFKSVDEWINLFTNMPGKIAVVLEESYGTDESLLSERRKAYIEVLHKFKDKFGSKKVVISRAPGRVNLMGRHVEHRGGDINVISISNEVIAVAGRGDNSIRITNTNEEFPDRQFNIKDHFRNIQWTDWLAYLDNEKITNIIQSAEGDWMNYVKAPIIKLQHTYRDRVMTGMDIAFSGNIPISAGLSSSSAIVVATAEAATCLNGMDVHPRKFVDMCGEGEWFVGSRGGAGDHAAMKFGQKGYIATLGFFPFGFKKAFEFPKGYKLVIANSFIKANKTTNAKDVFNQRIAAYEFGLMLLKENYPEYEDALWHLRDVNPEHLGVTQTKIYEMVKSLPETETPEGIKKRLPSRYYKRIDQVLKTHELPDYYNIRKVCMYGVAECRRAKLCGNLLEANNLKEFGRMMYISHDGDRVADKVGDMYESGYPDVKIDKLIEDLNSGDQYKVKVAQIENQPGGYSCSTPEVDKLIDIARKCEGVIGAQLSGAGLGGCVMVLVEENKVDNLVKFLTNEYYGGNSNDGITVCIPVKGSEILSIKYYD